MANWKEINLKETSAEVEVTDFKSSTNLMQKTAKKVTRL